MLFIMDFDVCMTWTKPNNNTYTDKQIATYNRQKCINLLEKIMKNLFRIFRDEETTKEQLSERFFALKERLDALGEVYLDAEYHREMKKYVEEMAGILAWTSTIDALREKGMTRLNRIQKTKNAITYKKEKHTKKKREI